MLDIRKLLFCFFCSLAVLAPIGLAGNVMENGNLAVDSSGWTYMATTGATGLMHADYDLATGNPAGCEKLWVDAFDASTNGYRFGQVLRVNKGQKYKLTGDWKGDLTGLLNDPTYGSGSRNWAEVFVGFFETYPPTDDWGTIRYKKAIGGTALNADPMPWDWQSILISPDATNPGPADGVFTATGQYMTVSINVGGRISSCDPTHPVFVYVDNFKILPCHDEAGTDCSADFKYIAWIANSWLACNIDPATSCY
jgi:hypothetical protein